jgi:hypothetical protein
MSDFAGGPPINAKLSGQTKILADVFFEYRALYQIGFMAHGGRSQVNDEELIVPFVCPQCGEKMVGPSGKTEFQQRIVILDKGRLRQLASDVSDFDYWSWM